ncbi:MAG: hypothetical protein IH985_09120, partial [Planctomycetes bacterium]|nr:hypothetical protein [Planctomycetota bacterium]
MSDSDRPGVSPADAPRTPAALHDWIARRLGVLVVRQPTVPGHAAPFDYICHAYFEGR